MKKEKLLVSLSAEATNRLFTEYCKRIQSRKKRFSKSSIIEELVMAHLPEATKHFDINNISKEEK